LGVCKDMKRGAASKAASPLPEKCSYESRNGLRSIPRARRRHLRCLQRTPEIEQNISTQRNGITVKRSITADA
jgi:hypothetical protein